MRYNQFSLTEATRPYTKKTVDPALMTFAEYRDIVDPDHKSHPSSAYQTTVKRLNSFAKAEQYPELVNTTRRNGIVFEIRKQTEDRYQGRYVKTTPDGQIVRDSNGNAQYLSQQEIAQLIPETQRYTSEYAVVHKKNNQVVATTSDEWGTVLVQTAQEYREFGFGTLLAKLKYTDEPTKPSGGFTPAGLATMRRVHAQQVRDYQQSGMYSFLVKQGTISAARAREIINSVRTGRTTKSNLNLDTTDPRDWLLLTDENASYAVLYDRKIYDLPPNMLETHWTENMIIGMVAIGGSKNYFIDRSYGTPKIKSFLLEVILNGEPEPIILEPEMYELAKRMEPKLEVKRITGDAGGGVPRPQIQVKLAQPTLNWQAMSNRENMYRKKRDPYGEMYSRILEIAESLTV